MIYTIWEQRKIFSDRNIKFLHIAPEKQFVDKFKKMENIDYYPCDINVDVYGVEHQVDVTNIQFQDKMFDIIMCSNVIEHVQEDKSPVGPGMTLSGWDDVNRFQHHCKESLQG